MEILAPAGVQEVQSREKNPNFSLDLQIFSADALEKQDTDLVKPGLFSSLNSRIQLTEESLRRYNRMMQTRFSRVFGNPPWGGVLKGQLAPVYDTLKKRRFADEYRAARGKYDVYGLFMERFLTCARMIRLSWLSDASMRAPRPLPRIFPAARSAGLRFIIQCSSLKQISH